MGSGLVIFKGNDISTPILTKSFGLPSYATVYNGESEVIPLALLEISKIYKSNPFSKAHFYIDNHATLKNLIKPWATKDTNIHRIYSNIQKLPFPITFTYVPAHQGHLGNEMADKAAKEGLIQPVTLFPKIPTHHFVDLIIINTSINALTQHRWNSEDHSHWIKRLFPNWKSLQSFLTLSEGLTQVRKLASGFYPLQNYLFQRSLKPNPLCPHCLDEVESIYHRVLTCPLFFSQRVQMLIKLDFSPNTTMEILASNSRNNLEALNTFLISSKLFAQSLSIDGNPSMQLPTRN